MYRIGELAKICDVKADTLRFYEKHGLLAPQSRSESGYRLYSSQDLQKMQFILRAKAVGFSLKEIQELLSIRVESDTHTCFELKGIADSKLAQVEAKLKELELFRQSLQKLSNSCCGGMEAATHCSILEALEDSDRQGC